MTLPRPAPDQLLTVSDVAYRLRVSTSWVRDHANGKRRPCLPSVKLGKAVRFRVEEVEAFLIDCARLADRKGSAA